MVRSLRFCSRFFPNSEMDFLESPSDRRVCCKFTQPSAQITIRCEMIRSLRLCSQTPRWTFWNLRATEMCVVHSLRRKSQFVVKWYVLYSFALLAMYCNPMQIADVEKTMQLIITPNGVGTIAVRTNWLQDPFSLTLVWHGPRISLHNRHLRDQSNGGLGECFCHVFVLCTRSLKAQWFIVIEWGWSRWHRINANWSRWYAIATRIPEYKGTCIGLAFCCWSKQARFLWVNM